MLSGPSPDVSPAGAPAPCVPSGDVPGTIGTYRCPVAKPVAYDVPAQAAEDRESLAQPARSTQERHPDELTIRCT